MGVKDRLFIYLIRQLLLRLKCQSTEIFLFAGTIWMILAPLVLGLTAQSIVLGRWLGSVAGRHEGLRVGILIVLRLVVLPLLIVREGVNLLVDG